MLKKLRLTIVARGLRHVQATGCSARVRYILENTKELDIHLTMAGSWWRLELKVTQNLCTWNAKKIYLNTSVALAPSKSYRNE